MELGREKSTTSNDEVRVVDVVAPSGPGAYVINFSKENSRQGAFGTIQIRLDTNGIVGMSEIKHLLKN